METAQTQYRIYGEAPTQYQFRALTQFGGAACRRGNGSWYVEIIFDKREDAEEYLNSRCKRYYDEDEARCQEQLDSIANYGVLEIDGVTCGIEELEPED